MKQVISIGKQDFASLRDENYFFIDKSDFIKEWWEAGDEITLITRPRRFGKTLNMSMLNCFFQINIPIGENYLRAYLSGKKKNIKEFKDAFQ